MRDILLKALNDYLLLFSEEQQRQSILTDHLKIHKDEETI